jgi:hypothetical protein
MPTIKKQAPLLSEGEYCGQARKVTMEWSKPKPGSKSESVQVFRIPLHTHTGEQVTTFCRVTPNTGWVFEQICKSGDLLLPDGEEFVIQADDLENRKFYFGIKHVDYNGAKIANVHFHSPVYAEQVNPNLKGVTFRNEAPRGVSLRSAPSPKPAAAPSTEERPPETSGTTVPEPPPQPQASASEVPKPLFSMEGLETLSEEALQEALEYAMHLRQEKQEGK